MLKTIAPSVQSIGNGKGKGVLLIDDLTDTGKTAKVVRELLPDAHFATVYAKPLGAPLCHTFVTEVSQDTWIHFPWDLDLQYAPPFRNAGAPPRKARRETDRLSAGGTPRGQYSGVTSTRRAGLA